VEIFISYWSKGNKTKVLSINNDHYLIRLFCEYYKKYDIHLICDSESYTELQDLSINFHITDTYNDYKSTEWPIVKLLNILDFYDEYIIHLDYDIFWNYDINLVFKYVKDNNINILYQSEDHNHSEYDKFNESYMNGVPYCAGLTIFNNIDNKKLKPQLLEFIQTRPDKKYFWYSMGIEQLYFPSLLKTNYTIKTLDDYIIDNHLTEQNSIKPMGIFEHFWQGLINSGAIKPSINYYHFLGSIKQNKRFYKEITQFINKL